MTLAIDTLKKRLSGVEPTTSFSLQHDELGLEEVTQLFQRYLPDETLFLTCTEAAADALRICGRLNLSSSESNATTVEFHSDEDEMVVSGLSISVVLHDWTLRLGGDYGLSLDCLKPLGVEDLRMVLSAIPGKNGKLITEASIQGCLPVGGQRLPIKADIPVNDYSNYIFTVSFEDFSVTDLSWFPKTDSYGADLLPAQLSDIIPDEFSDALSGLKLLRLRVAYNPILKDIFYINADIRIVESWTLSAGSPELKVENLCTSLFVFHPTVIPTLTAVFYGDLKFSDDVTLMVELAVPSLDASVRLKRPIQLSPVLKTFLPDAQLQDFQITDLALAYAPKSGDYSVEFAMVNDWAIFEGIALTNLSMTMQRDAAVSEAAISGRLELGHTVIELSADYETGEGWHFKGGTGDDSAIPLGELMADLGEAFGVADIPDGLKELDLHDLAVSYKTESKDFSFKGTCDFSVSSYPTTLALDIELKRLENGYKNHYKGALTVKDVHFELDFTSTDKASVITAKWSDKNGELTAAQIAELIGMNASDIPGDMLPHLKTLKLQYNTKDKAFSLQAQAADMPLTVGGMAATISDIEFAYPAADSLDEGTEAVASVSGKLTVSDKLSFSVVYGIPGDITIKGGIDRINLSEVIGSLLGSSDFASLDIVLLDSQIVLKRTDDYFGLTLRTEVESFGKLVFMLLKEESWGFAAGLQIASAKISDIPGLKDVTELDKILTLENIRMAISSVDIDGETIPFFDAPAAKALPAGEGASDETKDAKPDPLEVKKGFNLFTRARFVPSGIEDIQGLLTFLGVDLDGTVDLIVRTQPNPLDGGEISIDIESFKIGEVLVDGQWGLKWQKNSTPDLYLSAKVVVDKNQVYDVTLKANESGFLLSGRATTKEAINLGGIDFSDVALALGINAAGVPSFGLSARLYAESFTSSMTIYFDSTSPKNIIIAGALSSITFKDIVELFAGEGTLPVSMTDLLKEIKLEGTKQFVIDAPEFADSLNDHQIDAIQTTFHKQVDTFTPQKKRVAVRPAKTGDRWFLSDLQNMRHYELVREEGHIQVYLTPQVYIAPNALTIDGEPYPQGFFLNGALNIFGTRIETTINVNKEQGISIEQNIDKIVIGDILSFTDATGKGGPFLSLSTYKQPHHKIAEFQTPHFALSAGVSLLGIQFLSAFVLLTKDGFKLDTRLDINDRNYFHLALSSHQWQEFEGTMEFSVGINTDIDIEVITIHLDVAVTGSIKVGYKAGVAYANLEGAFVYDGDRYSVSLDLEINGDVFNHLDDLLLDPIKEELANVIEKMKQLDTDNFTKLFSEDDQLHIANRSSEAIYVLVYQDTGVQLRDYLTWEARATLTGGREDSLITRDMKIDNLLEILETYRNIQKLTHTFNTDGNGHTVSQLKDLLGAAQPWQQTLVTGETMSAFLKQYATRIEWDQVRRVNQKSDQNRVAYITPSSWNRMVDKWYLDVLVINESLTKFRSFRTDADHSWVVTNDSVVRATYGSLTNEDPNEGYFPLSSHGVRGGGTSHSPSLAVLNKTLYAAWKGVDNDTGLFYATFNGVNWQRPLHIDNIGTSAAPALCVYGETLYLAWKGSQDDTSIWYTSLDRSGTQWSAQQRIPDVGTGTGPTLSAYNGRLYAAWKGSQNDEGIWYASFDGSTWTSQNRIPNVGTSSTPGLVAYDGRLYAAWKGTGDDTSLWYASFDGNNWTSQNQIPNTGTSDGVALMVYNKRLYAFWKGSHEDKQVWFASFDGSSWSGQQSLSSPRTHHRPAVANFGSPFIAFQEPRSSSLTYNFVAELSAGRSVSLRDFIGS